MAIIRDSIYHTGLKIRVVDENKLGSKYPYISSGEEGVLYKYDNAEALKIFSFYMNQDMIDHKFNKLEELGRIKDKNFCFPKNIVGFLDLKKQGYGMELVSPYRKCKDFSELDNLLDMKKILEYIMIADKAIERIHKKGVILGDIRDDHIMINKAGEVKFIDTDNYAYGDYGFDIQPTRSNWLKRIYNHDFDPKDNDIFVYAIIALQHFVKGSTIRLNRTDEYFKELINCLNVSQEVKEGLRLILSDAERKPYLGKVLKKVDFENEFTSQKDISFLNL